MFSSNQKYYQYYPFLLLDAAQYANGKYIRLIAFEAISMDVSPECDMNLKGLTKKVNQIPRGHSTHTRMGRSVQEIFKHPKILVQL